MERSKEIFLRMRERDYNALSPEQRAKFTYVEYREVNEYENNKDDPIYIKLYKAVKKAKNDLQEYLFKKRNNLPF